MNRINVWSSISAAGLRAAGKHVAAIGLLAFSGVLFAELIMHEHALPALFDYGGNFAQAAHAIVHGASPYRPAFLSHLYALYREGRFGSSLSTFAVPVYPPPILLAALPFGVLPYAVGGSLFVVISAGGVVLALRLFGVRDWRCHAITLVSWPVMYGLWLGALSPLLLLGVAIVWRWRERVFPPAIALAVIVAAKLFPWPFGVWMLMTRRQRTLGVSIGFAVLGLIGCWATIGFVGMTIYPRMLSDLSAFEDRFGSSVAAQLLTLGLPRGLATAGAMAMGLALLIGAWYIAQHQRDEARAFGLAAMAALVAAPLVWPHYFVLAFVPVALLAPRLSPLWFVPLICGLSPEPGNAYPWALIPYLLVSAILVYRLCAVSPNHMRSAAGAFSVARLRSGDTSPQSAALTAARQ